LTAWWHWRAVGFIVLGCMVGLIGPTLPSLRANLDVTFERLGGRPTLNPKTQTLKPEP